jgi:hypothetical protein
MRDRAPTVLSCVPMRPCRRLRAALLCIAAFCVLSESATGMALAADVALTPAPGAVLTRLSDLHTLSQWAYPKSQAVVRAEPSFGAQKLGALRFLTTDKQAELYVVLESYTLASGESWLQLELPGRPNGLQGWVPRAALGSLHTARGYLLVNRSTLRATLFRDGRAVFSAPVGVGKPSTVTPAGHFYVLEKLRTVGNPAYGPYALGTSAYAPTLSEWPGGGVVGIHGTNEPQLIPGRPSHGCVRLRNGDMTRLWRLTPIATPIEIV